MLKKKKKRNCYYLYTASRVNDFKMLVCHNNGAEPSVT